LINWLFKPPQVKIVKIGNNTVLMRGPKSREALRHFGAAPGTKGSHTKPYARNRNSEIARGR
jgi:large subunit ribosomal protein L18e